jgi:hypothetical protein
MSMYSFCGTQSGVPTCVKEHVVSEDSKACNPKRTKNMHVDRAKFIAQVKIRGSITNFPQNLRKASPLISKTR